MERRQDLIFLHQLRPNLLLVTGGLVAHGIDLVDRADEVCRVLVTFQTPGHVEGIGFHRCAFCVHAPVTCLASHALGNMDRVVKVDVIRHAVDPVPYDGLAGLPAIAHGLEQRAIERYLAVTAHARLSRRQIGEGRLIHKCMAVAAVQLQHADMETVWKRYGLRYGDADLVVGRRMGPQDQRAGDDSHENQHQQDADSGDKVAAR